MGCPNSGASLTRRSVLPDAVSGCEHPARVDERAATQVFHVRVLRERKRLLIVQRHEEGPFGAADGPSVHDPRGPQHGLETALPVTKQRPHEAYWNTLEMHHGVWTYVVLAVILSWFSKEAEQCLWPKTTAFFEKFQFMIFYYKCFKNRYYKLLYMSF